MDHPIDGFVRIEESDMLLYPDLVLGLVFPWEIGSKNENSLRLLVDLLIFTTPMLRPLLATLVTKFLKTGP